jgi:hypothetical protein
MPIRLRSFSPAWRASSCGRFSAASIRAPAKPFPQEAALQNDIEDLSYSFPQLKGKKAGDFLDLSLLKSLEEEGFFKRLHGK